MTVSGNPASFVVRGAAAKVNSLTVPFSPIQSLNGYSHPWPAGGGKNLDPYDNLNNSSRLWANNNNQKAVFQSLPTGTYTMSCKFKVLTNPDSEANVKYGVLVRYSDGGGGYVVIIPYQLTTAPATVGAVYEWHKSFTLTESLAEQSTLEVYFYCANGGLSTTTANAYDIQIEKGDIANPTFAPYENICPISGRMGLSVFVGPTTSQADATTYAVDWTSEAGTVYGGTLDVVTGLLTMDRAYASVASVANKTEYADGYFWYSTASALGIPAISGLNAELISDRFVKKTNVTADDIDGVMAFYANNIIRWKEKGDLTLADYRTYLASNPFHLCYELATPLTYQLTPQEVELLVGLNNVWSDTDSVITIDYDVLSFIRQKFIVNGTDFSRFVERDSYQTSLSPVYGETVQTIDGVGHTARLRLKGALRLALNPQTDTDTAAICTELLNSPCEVIYHCLQRDADVAARMTIDTVSASFLSRCLYWGDEWNQIDPITLTEL